MGNFPSAAAQLAERQAQQPTVFQQYAQAQQIKAAQTQQQTAALQQTGLQQENQQRALQLQDQNTLRSLSSKHLQKDSSGNVTGFDFDGLIKDAGAAGVNPALLNQMQNQRAEAIKNIAGADEATRANEQAKNKAQYETLESIRAIKDLPGRQAALQQALPSLQKQGINIPPNSPLDDASLDHFEAGLGMHAQVLADAKTASETNKANEQANLAKMEATEKGSPLTKMENDPTMFAGEKLPASMAYLESKVNDSDAATAARASRLLSTAKASENIQLARESQKARTEASARQAAAQGDPNVAGHMLADGSLTLADLKSRGTTPEYITKAVAAAQKEKPDYKPADEVIAETVAKSQGANQFFGSANSLIAKGGTLDQLEAQGKKIPNEKLPILNTFEDWQQLAKGKGPLAGYAATALGVADDYGKVMGGGTASDHARDAALRLFAAASSPEMRADAIKATRDAVGSQRDSRIGNNQFLKRLYGDQPSSGGGSGETKHVAGGKATGLTEGQTGKGSDGKPYVVKGGVWVAQ